MASDLARRVDRLYDASGRRAERAAENSFEKRTRALADRLAVDQDLMVRLTKDHEEGLSATLDDRGLITWTGFCLVHNLLRGTVAR